MNKIKNEIKKILFEKVEKTVSFEDILETGIKYKLPVFIESKKGTIQKWNKNIPIPFDYGEIPGYLNPADNMPWDILVAPTSSTENLLISGVVLVKPDANKLNRKEGNKPGNHKLILSSNGILTPKDKNILNEYFSDLKAFESPKYYDKQIDEDWAKHTLGNYKLGKFQDVSYKGFAVGGVARRFYGAGKIKNNLPKTVPYSGP